jgi:hypothetical protein
MSSLRSERPIRHLRTMPQRIILHPVTVRLSFSTPEPARNPLSFCPTATSSGGRQTGPVSQPDGGSGGTDLRGQLQSDAPHGRDPSAESLDTRKEAVEALAARYHASREWLHEGHGTGVNVIGA